MAWAQCRVTIGHMPNDRPASGAGTYCITAIDNKLGASAIAAGMTFRKAVELRAQLRKLWPDVAFIVEPEMVPDRFDLDPPIYQIVGVNDDRSRMILMIGMTLEQAESTRDALLETDAFIWIWIEREPVQG